jgi:phage shock protein PspC (stress-responsive transcriptional regulator)
VTRDEVRDLGRLRRSAHDRKVAGVAGGLARHLDIDPLILRVAFVVLAFFGGAGLLLYGACWLLVPEEETGEAVVTLDERSRTVALLIVGALAVFALLGDSWGVFWFPWPVAVIAAVVLWMATRKDRTESPPGSGGATYVPAHDAPAPEAGDEAGDKAGDKAGDVRRAAEAPTFGTTAWEWQGAGSSGSTQWAYGWQGGTPVGTTGQAWEATPRGPRRAGPVLFWFTLALIALGVGLLGTLDVAGAAFPDSAYPALALGIVGVMLVVGSFWGRAGGLILLGLLTTVGLAGATAADEWEGERVTHAPTTAAQVDDVYDFGAGELTLDLTGVRDLETLDGQDIRVEGGVGQIELVLPDGLDVTVDGEVGGPGSVYLFGDRTGGIDNQLTRSLDGGPDAPAITIDAQLGVGEIHAVQQ